MNRRCRSVGASRHAEPAERLLDGGPGGLLGRLSNLLNQILGVLRLA